MSRKIDGNGCPFCMMQQLNGHLQKKILNIFLLILETECTFATESEFVLNYIKIIPRRQRLVGLKSEHLEQLKADHPLPKSNRNSGRKVRIIKEGGRKVKLSIEEQILLTLILRHLTTFQLLASSLKWVNQP